MILNSNLQFTICNQSILFFCFVLCRWILGTKLRTILNLIQLLITIIMVAHVFACIWIFIHYYQQAYWPSETTWIVQQ